MSQSIIYFDNLCVLCSRSVRFIYKNDPRGKFHFASLKSDNFERKIEDLKVNLDSIPDSIVLFHRDKIFTRSGAALRIVARLRFPLPLLTIFFIIPRFLRNPLYDLIASNRYRWFGKKDQCFVPEESMRGRFIEK